MNSRPQLNTLRDDGGDRKVTEEELQELYADVDEIKTTLDDMGQTLDSMEDLRYCRWAGQSPDGRKRSQYIGKEAKPFEGASDGRLPTCDSIINAHVVEYMNAAGRIVPRVKGTEGTDEAVAGKIGTMLKYVIHTIWGREYRRNLEVIANYMEADYPAAGLMEVYWHRERGLRYETIDAYGLIQLYYQFAQSMPEEANSDEFMEDLFDIVENPARAEDLKGLIQAVHPTLKASRLNKLAKQFYAEGIAEFPVPYIKENNPQIRPLRINVNCFLQSNTRDLNRSRGIYVIEHINRAEVEERATAEGWARAFVEQLIGKDGEDGARGMSAFWSDETLEDEEFCNLYEIIRGYKYTTNEDGVPGIYRYTFSKYCNVADKTPRNAARSAWENAVCGFCARTSDRQAAR